MKSYDELKAWARRLDVQSVFDMSQSQKISGTDRSIVYSVAKILRTKDVPSFKQLRVLERVFDKLSAAASGNSLSSVGELTAHANKQALDIDVKHLCLRTAWHDAAWNGKVCRNPSANEYCIGEHSLLSDRLRRRRNLDIEGRTDCAGCKADSPSLGEYQPPCFWSINTFGQKSLTFSHDNPVEPDFPHIPESLPPYSLISWPFNLSFVRNPAEKEKYGSYYPKAIFENRIRLFQRNVKSAASVVFTYCNFSNPVSGEEMKYLVTGCALLAEQAKPQYFDVTEKQLAATASKLNQPNFPKMNWALRYTLDMEHTGVRLPYHEYLESTDGNSRVPEAYLQDIAVTIDEPELRDGFTYVAKHIDDDEAIYLLTKIRRSLLKVREHGLLDLSNTDTQLERIEDLIGHTWTKRGYLPGLKNLFAAMPGLKDNYMNRIVELIEGTDLSDQAAFESIRAAMAGRTNEISASFEDLFEEIREFMKERDLTAEQLLRLASLNLSTNQFRRIIAKEGISKQLAVVCENPYLLYEEYEVGENVEDDLSGERIDGLIDIFKIDIGLIPLAKYQKRVKDFHNWRTNDRRRLRAVVIQILRDQESTGNCFLERSEIATQAKAYSLFYKADTDYEVEDDISAKDPDTERHFGEKLVTRTVADKRFIYLKEIFDDEIFVQSVITELHDRNAHKLSAASLEADIGGSIAVLSARLGQRFDGAVFREERQSLYRQIASKSLFVITGFPGSGKSNELLKLIRFFNVQGETHVVLSLTGKAVIRLKNNEEGIQSVNAKTVDKFLYEQQNVNAQAVVSVINNLIIDEASMLDLPKLADVIRSIDRTHLRRLIFVGDPNQLPPIGFGKPFSDLISLMEANPEAYAPHWVRLEVNCRAEMSDEFIGFTRVFSNDSKFAEGHLHQTQVEGVLCGGGLEVVFWQSREELQDRLETKVVEMLRSGNDAAIDLPKFLGITGASKKPSGLDRFQVLSPYRSGYFGASGINLFFQDALRREVPFQRKAGKEEVVFKIFDKVMHTQNEYKGSELLVSNGSLGAIVESGKVFFVDNKSPIIIKSLKTQSMLELAYAITVHKSQGSGFGHVFIVLPEKAQRIPRELLYTALTRAKNHVTIFIQQGRDILAAPHFLHGIMSRSAVVGRKTSLFRAGGDQYSYAPDDGVVVKSRVEYIIYRKLLEAKSKYANFSFVYEGEYEVNNQPFNIHPDFVIQLADSRVIYWEHLGRVTSKSYMNDWDRRRAIYESQNDLSKVLTTDELRGISDEKIEQIVKRIVANDIVSEDDSNRYSTMHFSLR